MNQDPIEEWGGLNLYAFLVNDDVNTFDSIGLFPCTADWKGPADWSYGIPKILPKTFSLGAGKYPLPPPVAFAFYWAESTFDVELLVKYKRTVDCCCFGYPWESSIELKVPTVTQVGQVGNAYDLAANAAGGGVKTAASVIKKIVSGKSAVNKAKAARDFINLVADMDEFWKALDLAKQSISVLEAYAPLVVCALGAGEHTFETPEVRLPNISTGVKSPLAGQPLFTHNFKE